jgi:riboflavin biosynthesis pyrimidine reductase
VAAALAGAPAAAQTSAVTQFGSARQINSVLTEAGPMAIQELTDEEEGRLLRLAPLR